MEIRDVLNELQETRVEQTKISSLYDIFATDGIYHSGF
jgi:hypothetical protein